MVFVALCLFWPRLALSWKVGFFGYPFIKVHVAFTNYLILSLSMKILLVSLHNYVSEPFLSSSPFNKVATFSSIISTAHLRTEAQLGMIIGLTR